jgi:hypothetical protein
MGELETNIYPILNLNELSTRYRFVDVAGLHADQAEYFQNRQALERKLSYGLKRPVLVVERGDKPYLVAPEDVTMLPSEVNLVRTVVQLSPQTDVHALDYTRRSPEDDVIALRFLRFLVQAPLRADGRLWQPGAGRPFFERTPARAEGGIHCYVGFTVRPVVTPDGGIGLCVDVTSCYVGADALSATLTRDEFAKRWKGRNCIYRFGDDWYEVHLHGLADRNVTGYRFLKDNTTWSLLDYVLDHASRPLASHLANLAEDAAVVLYLDKRGNELGAPAPLCYPVFPTSSEQVARQHGRSILAPQDRRKLTQQFASRFLGSLRFGDTQLRVAGEPLRIPARIFPLPDLQFGNGVVLSARGTSGAIQAKVSDFGNRRLNLLRDRAAGFFTSAPLDRQYVLLPRSIHDSFGGRFLEDLAAVVNDFFPQQGGYTPTLVPYDDRGKRTFVRQGLAIRAAVEQGCRQPGYALVMVHRPVDRRERDEDQLAAMVVRELRAQWDIRAAVIHTDVPTMAYHEEHGEDGRIQYRCASDQGRRLAGYLRNVAITKILLTNQRWPFVLSTPLHADVTVGIDVKYNTAGLLVVSRNGSEIRSELRESRQKEWLLTPQMATYLGDVLRREAEARGAPLASFVVQRDGRVPPSEVEAVRQVFRRLRSDGHLTADARYGVIEIPKTSPAPLRLYYVKREPLVVRNPLVGAVYIVGQREAYLCTTGAPFLRQGTAHPLHVFFVDGTLPFEHCLEDLYCLTTLAWTQPEGCTRDPITTKLNDRVLAVEAGEYDVDALEFGPAAEDSRGEEVEDSTGEEVA